MSNGQQIAGDNNYQAGRDLHVNLPKPYRLPSLLSQFLPVLAKHCLDSESEEADVPYTIEGKIEYNSLRSTKLWIEEYGQFGSAIDRVYAEFDGQRPNSKKKILRSLRVRYQLQLASLCATRPADEQLDVVRSNADALLLRAVTEVIEVVKGEDVVGLIAEDVEPAAIMIVVHAFVNCQILERPPEAK